MQSSPVSRHFCVITYQSSGHSSSTVPGWSAFRPCSPSIIGLIRNSKQESVGKELDNIPHSFEPVEPYSCSQLDLSCGGNFPLNRPLICCACHSIQNQEETVKEEPESSGNCLGLRRHLRSLRNFIPKKQLQKLKKLLRSPGRDMRGYDSRMGEIVKEPYEVDSPVHEMFAPEFQQAAVYSNPYEAQPPTNAYELEAGVGSIQQVPYYNEPYQHSRAQFEFPEAGHNVGMYSFQREHFASAGTPTLGIAIPNTPPEMYAGPLSSGPSSGGTSAGEAATFTPASSTRSGGSPTGSQDSCNFHHSPLSQGFGAVRNSTSSLGSQSPQHLQYNAQPPTPHASTWAYNGVEYPSSAIVTPLNTAPGQSYDASLPWSYPMAQNHPTQFSGTAEIGATTHLLLEITEVCPPRCDQCNKPFLGHYGKSNLTRHKRTVHSNTSHPCSICGRNFKRTDALKKHSDKKHKSPLQGRARMPVVYPTSPMLISELAGSPNYGPGT